MSDQLTRFAPISLAVFRIVTALLFIQHGMQKLFFLPPGGHQEPPFVLFSLMGLAGVLEFFGGLLVLVGFMTRPVAFVLCGQMAVAYFMVHGAGGLGRPWGLFPVVNGGDLAILFCFAFLHLVFAGPGAFSVDGTAARRVSR